MEKFSKAKRNFTSIANEVLRDSKLSYKAKGLMCVIMGLPDNWDFSVKGIASISIEGETAIRAAIKELQDAGYCCSRNCYENGKIKCREYFFSDSKSDVINKQDEWDKIREEKKENLNEENLNEENLNEENLNEENLNEENLNEGFRNTNKEYKELNKENNKETLETSSRVKERLSHKYNGDVPLTDREVEYYLGMEKKYPRIMRMDKPLLYKQYIAVCKTGHCRKKIMANLEAMENYKPIKDRVSAYQVLLNFLRIDKREYNATIPVTTPEYDSAGKQ